MKVLEITLECTEAEMNETDKLFPEPSPGPDVPSASVSPDLQNLNGAIPLGKSELEDGKVECKDSEEAENRNSTSDKSKSPCRATSVEASVARIASPSPVPEPPILSAAPSASASPDNESVTDESAFFTEGFVSELDYEGDWENALVSENQDPHTNRPRSRCRAPSPDLPSRIRSPSPMRERFIQSANQYESSKFYWRHLENVGFTCYVNSTMQALAGCWPFFVRAQRVLRLGGRKLVNFEESGEDLRLMYSFFNICVKLAKEDVKLNFEEDEPTERICERELKILCRQIPSLSRTLVAGEQHDAHEFFMEIRSNLDEKFEKISRALCYKGIGISSLNPMKVFTLKTVKSYTCHRCGHSVSEAESETDVLLLLGTELRQQSVQDLIIRQFADKMDEKKCSSCQCSSVKCEERISSFPEILVVTLMRYDERGDKIDCEVSVSQRLTLPEHCKEGNWSPEKGDGDFSREPYRQKCIEPYYRPLRSIHLVEQVLHRLSLNVVLRKHFQQFADSEYPMSSSDKFFVEDIVRDHDSLYRSVTWWLTSAEDYHDHIRQKARTFCERKIHQFHQLGYSMTDLETFTEADRNPGSSTLLDIVVLATLLQVNIYVHENGEWTRTKPAFRSSFTEEAIYLNLRKGRYAPINEVEQTAKDIQNRKRNSPVVPHDEQQKKMKMQVQGAETTYSLVSVISHQGDSAERGHYVAYTKELCDRNGTQWLFCSDTSVHEILEKRMRAETSTNGYIFFYRKDVDVQPAFRTEEPHQ